MAAICREHALHWEATGNVVRDRNGGAMWHLGMKGMRKKIIDIERTIIKQIFAL